ncbi:hypothetical protein [Castellaniella sp. S9]|uniref:hypothetical protein n=1 Tax=Castellaniella sp. S9 TaxID=2993652 RepID=UPI0022B30CD5|nr:hypothetical protein [Castellaniella sp. S9]
MFLHNNTILTVFVLGVIATFIGFGIRDRNPGIILLGIGFLGILAAVIAKAIQVFG